MPELRFGWHVFIEGGWSALAHFFLDGLEVAEVDVVLPMVVDLGELFALQEDVRAFVASLNLIVFVLVLATYEVSLLRESLVVDDRRSPLVREGDRWNIFAAHHKRRVLEGLALLTRIHSYYYIAAASSTHQRLYTHCSY